MIVSHRHKFIYYAPAKTGTSTITNLLQSQFGAWETSGRHDCFLPEEYQSYFTFATVRNPYHRARSGWAYFEYQAKDKPASLEDWIAMPWFRSMFDTLFANQKEGCVPVRLDAILHMERLEDDFANLPFVKDRINLQRENRSKPKAIQLSKKAIQVIQQKYELDFSVFGYDPQDYRQEILML